MTTKHIDFCCDKMKKAFDNKFICFYDGSDDAFNSKTRASVSMQTSQCYAYEYYDDYMKITYCPFCKEEIKTIEEKKEG